MALRGSDNEILQCWHCEAPTQHSIAGRPVHSGTTEVEYTTRDNQRLTQTVPRVHYVYQCVVCGQSTYILLRLSFAYPDGGELKETPPEMLHMFPVATPSSHSALPGDVRNAAVERKSV